MERLKKQRYLLYQTKHYSHQLYLFVLCHYSYSFSGFPLQYEPVKITYHTVMS